MSRLQFVKLPCIEMSMQLQAATVQTERSSSMELFKDNQLFQTIWIVCTFTWIQTRLASIRDGNTIAWLHRDLTGGTHHGTPNKCVLELFVSLCHSVNTCTATHKIRLLVNTGLFNVIIGVATNLHSWAGLMELKTHGTTLKWSLDVFRMPLLTLLPTVGAMIFPTQLTGDGTQRRITPITSPGRDMPSQRRLTTDSYYLAMKKVYI